MTPSPSVPHLTSITPHDTHVHARNTVSVRSLTYAAEANELISDTTSLYIDQHSLNVLSCAALWREMMLEYLRATYSRGTTASFYDPVVSSFYWFSPIDLTDDASADNTAIVCDAVTVRAAVFHRISPQATIGATRHEFDSDYLAAADARTLDSQCVVWYEARIDAAWIDGELANIAERNATQIVSAHTAARTMSQQHLSARRQARMRRRSAIDLCEMPKESRNTMLRQLRTAQPDAQLPPKGAPVYTVHHLPEMQPVAQPAAQRSHARQQHPVPRVPGAWVAEVRRLVDLGADIDTAWVCQAGTSTSAQPVCLPLRDCV